jgi:hypothetical protein
MSAGTLAARSCQVRTRRRADPRSGLVSEVLALSSEQIHGGGRFESGKVDNCKGV